MPLSRDNPPNIKKEKNQKKKRKDTEVWKKKETFEKKYCKIGDVSFKAWKMQKVYGTQMQRGETETGHIPIK